MEKLLSERLLTLFDYAANLKNLPRGGWLMKGVRVPESLADHSYNVAFISMILARELEAQGEEPVDMGQLLQLALIHDLPESIITDIPSPMTRFFGREVKRRAEAQALEEMLGKGELFMELHALWEGFEDRDTPEGRIVRAADKIDMILMVLHYEGVGHRNLQEFWEDGDAIFYERLTGGERELALYRGIYEALKSRRLKPGERQ